MTEHEIQLNQLEQRLVRAWIESDWETIDAILDDDWSVIDPAGRVLNKQQVLNEAQSGERKIDTGTIDEVKVKEFENVAIVTGRTTAVGSYQGSSFSVRLRFTDVCVRRGDAWQVVASQGTLIAQ
ncbi:MAG: nuclear transport factor 2 family protein [Pyrinomonadaceae bacterium]|nr:nuclear transport factor 2 family protein [Pyrinomonadaceae bacterium]